MADGCMEEVVFVYIAGDGVTQSGFKISDDMTTLNVDIARKT